MVVVAAPILDDYKRTVIGTVTILLRRDTIFHAIADVTIGATGHAMLFSSDGVPVICPVLAPEEHTVKPELISALGGLKVRLDRCRRRFAWQAGTPWSDSPRSDSVESLAPGSLGGKQWITVVRQDPQETYAPLAELVAKVLLYGLLSLPCCGGQGCRRTRGSPVPFSCYTTGCVKSEADDWTGDWN